MSMMTAKSNFTHVIKDEKDDSHVLVTTGIYSWMRHPSYFGWFYWSIGTQLLLCNPICFLGYTYASWKFFDDRIRYEEYNLINFFDQQYIEYMKNTPVRIPFIYGLENMLKYYEKND